MGIFKQSQNLKNSSSEGNPGRRRLEPLAELSENTDLFDNETVSEGKKVLNRLPSFSKLVSVKGHSSEVIGLFPIPDSSAFLSVSKEGLVLLWDSASMKAYRLFSLPGNYTFAGISFRRLELALSDRKEIKLYSLLSGETIRTLPKRKARITSLVLSPVTTQVLFGSSDSKIYQWDYKPEEKWLSGVRKKAVVERYVKHASIVSAVAYHPHGRVFFSGDWLGALNAWSGYTTDPHGGAFDQNILGSRYFTDRVVRIKGPKGNADGIDHVIVGSDGKYLLIGLQVGRIELFKVRGFKKVLSFEAHKGLIHALAFDMDLLRIASYGRDGRCKVWEIIEKKDRLIHDKGDPYIVNLVTSFRQTGIQHLFFNGPRQIVAGTREGKVISLSGEKEEPNEIEAG